MGFILLGIVLIAYGAFCLVLGLFKAPASVWNMGKIQGFRKILKDVGTQIFVSVWGGAALGFGIYFLVNNLGK